MSISTAPGLGGASSADGTEGRSLDPIVDAEHEQVVVCRDDSTGLRAVIAVHSTQLGPALGGTRYHAYTGLAAAVADVLRLSRGMTYKAAAAGLPLGGGKAVILGGPDRPKSRDMLLAYGRFVESLGGRYTTAADVGTTAEDLDVIGEVTEHVVGRTAAAGGSGDSGLSTAAGVFEAMNAAAQLLWGATGLQDRRVGVEGVGKVGRHLVRLLLAAGARVVVSDPYAAAVAAVQQELPDVLDLPTVLDADVDVYAPCALGARLTTQSVGNVRAQLICGAANNQLLTSDVDELLQDRGIVWVPDYVANAGGLIQVGGERLGHDQSTINQGVEAIGATVSRVYSLANVHGVTLGRAAEVLVEERLAAAALRPGS